MKEEVPSIFYSSTDTSLPLTHPIFSSIQIARKQKDLKKKLKVTFAGEPGLDMGGLTKEWFLLLIRKIFKPEYGEKTSNLIIMCYDESID